MIKVAYMIDCDNSMEFLHLNCMKNKLVVFILSTLNYFYIMIKTSDIQWFYILFLGYLDWDVVWNFCSNYSAYYHHL